MNDKNYLKNALLTEHSRQQMLQIVNFTGNDPEKLKVLIELFLSGDYRLNPTSCLAIELFCRKKSRSF